MLIFTRRPGESVMVGDQVRVTVVSVERKRVRIGVDAPKDVVVDREEIAKKKRQSMQHNPAVAED